MSRSVYLNLRRIVLIIPEQAGKILKLPAQFYNNGFMLRIQLPITLLASASSKSSNSKPGETVQPTKTILALREQDGLQTSNWLELHIEMIVLFHDRFLKK